MEYDLVLVNPLLQFKTGNNFVEYLGFSYIAAYLRDKGYKIKILDIYLEGLSLEESVRILINTPSRVIGFTSMSSLYVNNMKKILTRLDDINRIYTIGGIYATKNYEHILKDVERLDYVFLGEGEKTWEKFLYNLNNGISLKSIKGIAFLNNKKVVSNGMSDFLTQEEILKLPRPAHDTLELSLKNDGIAQIATSRGCYGNCSFCTISNYYNNSPNCRWRYYDIKMCVDELEHLVNSYHVNYVDFCDEEFIGPNTEKNNIRLQYFINEIQRRKINVKYMIYCRSNDVEENLFAQLKDSGLDRVFIGIEFGNNLLLKKYGKGIKVDANIRAINILKKLNIKLSVGYIMFEPFMDLKLLKENIDFYFEYCPFKLDRLATKIGIFPNTKLYEESKEILSLQKTTWDFILGDYYTYHFLDEKVEIVYEGMVSLKGILQKSNSYYKIKINSKNQKEYEIYFSRWKTELHGLINKFIEQLEELENYQLVSENLVEHFKSDITLWDHTYML